MRPNNAIIYITPTQHNSQVEEVRRRTCQIADKLFNFVLLLGNVQTLSICYGPGKSEVSSLVSMDPAPPACQILSAVSMVDSR